MPGQVTKTRWRRGRWTPYKFKRTPDLNVQWCISCKTFSPFGKRQPSLSSLGCSIAGAHDNNMLRFGCPCHSPFHNFSHWVYVSLGNVRLEVSSRCLLRRIFQCLATWVCYMTLLKSQLYHRLQLRILWHSSIVTYNTIEQFAWPRHRKFDHIWQLTDTVSWAPVWPTRTDQDRWLGCNQRCSIPSSWDNRRSETWYQYLEKIDGKVQLVKCSNLKTMHY
jgi:hypothetical protein